jgi:leukotriene-A4 hydrolase
MTGDRSLVDVVVHELTHSWFGNGITYVVLYLYVYIMLMQNRHANPSHFWLNEGWTTYIERVLQEKLYSPAHRGFSYLIGSKALYDSLKQYQDQPKYQRLVISFEEGEDPDEAYSSVPYEKGANFLLYLGKPNYECIR